MINWAKPPGWPDSGLLVSQRHSTESMQMATVAIMVLKRPRRSATKPGAQRPKKDPTFRIERSW